MNNKLRLVALTVAIILVVGMCAGCAKTETVEIHNPEDAIFSDSDGELIQLAAEMVPLTAAPAMNTVRTPAHPGTSVNKNQKAEIDYSNAAQGYVMIKYLVNTTKQLRVIIEGPSKVKYQYTLNGKGEYEVFPLSDGSGSYTIGIYEQIEGTRYATSHTATISVTLTNEFEPFLRPNQYVNFNANSQVVTKAAELVSGVTDFYGKVAAVYNFVVTNFTYDKEKAATVPTGYLPNVDQILSLKKGICFDYAAVMAAMLRSQDIPTKLIVGYAGDVYHAWINVYSEATGWVNNAIYFDGKEWKLMDPTFASSGNQSASVMQYIGDGSHYTARFMY